MVRFLLLFLYGALVTSADAIPRVRSAETNDIDAMLMGRGRKTCLGGGSEPYDIQLNQLSYSPYAQISAKI